MGERVSPCFRPVLTMKVSISLLPTLIILTSFLRNVVVSRMVVRLGGVLGLEGRRNDVLFTPAVRRAPDASVPRALVYWGGDVQDYPEVMKAHRDNRNYRKWNLENTARILSHNFPTSHIVVVRPSRIEFKSFSCFDNFVPSNNAGVPDHTPTHSALLHLERLLQSVSSRIKAIPEHELLEALDAATVPEDIDIELLPTTVEATNGAGAPASPADALEPVSGPPQLWWRPQLALHEAQLSLVGFSKGCVVLNQFLYEFHYTATLTPTDSRAGRFISNIRAMYWLDGGHAGGRNTWLTSRCLLETLVRLNVQIFVHVSPYQVHDETRPWIGREERAFTALLKKLGADIHRYLHDAGGAPASLQMHFDVVGNFRRLQDAVPDSIPGGDDEQSEASPPPLP